MQHAAYLRVEILWYAQHTLRHWLQQPEFKVDLERQRQQVTDEAFCMLSQSLTQAVETLVELLDSQDERSRRLAANNIIAHFLKHKELKDLEQRITAIEQRLDERG